MAFMSIEFQNLILEVVCPSPCFEAESLAGQTLA
jgi:hypothetical protein